MLSVAPTCQYTICAISLYAGRTVQNVKEEKKNTSVICSIPPVERGRSVKLAYYRHHRSGQWQ